MRIHSTIASRSSQTTVPVATAQPSAPIFGKPRLPNTSTQLTITLTTRPMMAITITGLVWLMLAL
jgi:hypothetical protein